MRPPRRPRSCSASTTAAPRSRPRSATYPADGWRRASSTPSPTAAPARPSTAASAPPGPCWPRPRSTGRWRAWASPRSASRPKTAWRSPPPSTAGRTSRWGATCARRSNGTPVTMATDVKAAALAEARWGALAGVDPGVYLNLGTGLAAAIVAGGRVLAGANGAAGEIGYNLRRLSRRRLRRLRAAGGGGQRPGAGPAGRAARRRGVRGRRGHPARRRGRRVHHRARLPRGEPRHLHRPGQDRRRRRHDQILGPDPAAARRGPATRPLPTGRSWYWPTSRSTRP